MEREKRRKYFIITNIFWWIGFVLYGGLAVAGKALLEIPINGVLLVLIYSMVGGLLIGGLSCGFILFSRFFMKQVLVVRIILCFLFSLSLICIVYVGIFAFFPYGIYNFVAMKKEKN